MAKPIIGSGTFTGEVVEDDSAKAVATGSIGALDDDGPVTYAVRSGAGKFGTLTVDETTGAWRYDIDEAAAQPLDDDGSPADPVETFTIRIAGTGGASDFTDATVRVTVRGANDLPTVGDDAFATSEDRPLTVGGKGLLANDSDPDGDPLSATLVDDAKNGTVALAANGTFVYTPDKDFSGTESFTYRVSDGTGTSGLATVSIEVAEVAEAPTVGASSITVDADEAGKVTGQLPVADGDGEAVVVSAAAGKLGTLEIGNDGKWSYDLSETLDAVRKLPAGGRLVETIAVTATDETGKVGRGSLTFEIQGTNDEPTAEDDTVSTDENKAIANAALANDSDPDTGDKLKITAVTDDGNGGTATTDGARIFFDPGTDFDDLAAGETATVEIDYEIEDGKGGTAEATVTVEIQGRNDAPVAASDSAKTAEDTAVTIDVLANDDDVDGDALDIVSLGGSRNGTVEIVDGEVVFTPAANFNGTTSFTYVATDGTGRSNTATVTVEVAAVNDAPTTVADRAQTNEGQAVTVAVLANDSDPDKDTFTLTDVDIVDGKGSVAIATDGKGVTFTPDASFEALGAGESSVVKIEYEVTDAAKASSKGTLEVTVRGLNDAPVANGDKGEVEAGGTVTVDVLANDTDPDTNDVLDVSGARVGARQGKVSVKDGQVVYDTGKDFVALGAGETADVDVAYTLIDGKKGSATGKAVVTVTGVNDGPTAVADTARTSEDEAVSIAALANDTDPDANDTLKITKVAIVGASGGEVGTDGTKIVYDPSGDFESLGARQSAQVSIEYSIDDGKGGTATATAQVTVTGANDAPTATNDKGETTENAALTVDVVANDTDVDTGDRLSVRSAAITEGEGSVKVQGGSIRFDPGTAYDDLAAGEKATVKITYTVADTGGGTATGELDLTVTGENDGPKATDDKATTTEDTSVIVDVLANDTDVDGDPLTITANFANVVGGAVSVVDGKVVFEPDDNFNGNGGFTYEIADGQGGTSTANVLVAVAAANDAPRAGDGEFAVEEDKSVTLNLVNLASDIDQGDVLRIDSVDTSSTLGSVVIGPRGVTYAADAAEFDLLADGKTLTDTFTYTVIDRAGLTATGKVTMTITGVADGGAFPGTDGNDTFRGTKGEDFVTGGAGDDTLGGAEGADTLDGGEGNDRLTGGTGPDVFFLSTGEDVITDFAKGKGGDTLDLGKLVGTVAQGDLDNFLQFTKVGANTEVFIDLDGKGEFATPDARTTVLGVDLIAGAGGQQAVIDKLVADGNLAVS